MKTLLLELKTSLLLTVVFAVLLCGLYPVVVWAGAQALFANKANGSLILDKDGTVRGSALLAQNFSSDKYFQPRASAAGTGYDATSSGGTNFGPTSQKLSDSIKAAVAAYRTSNGLAPDAPVPADAVTSTRTSASPMRSCRPRGSRRRAGFPLRRCRRSWPQTRRAGTSASWARPG